MKNHYWPLAVELAIDGLIMFAVMYAMVDSAGEVFLNTNNLYMALAMAAPMGVVMLVTMRKMFPDRKKNLVILVALAAVFVGSMYSIRAQAGVGDKQFLRAMIPHHSGAIVMCREAELEDPQVVDLCDRIEASQRAEIEEMKGILNRL